MFPACKERRGEKTGEKLQCSLFTPAFLCVRALAKVLLEFYVIVFSLGLL